MLSMSTVSCFESLPCVWGVEIAVVGVIVIVNKGGFWAAFCAKTIGTPKPILYLRQYRVLINY